ncbi:MAG TPA: purine-nucleoside phosphorylase [Pararhizobium sp.]|nr:purine-nucleoside phosphorylase [Pararhizobium sp.]
MSAAAEALTERLRELQPRDAVVLGSGLGPLARAVSDPIRIAFSELPGFPLSAVSGHAGEIVAGHLGHTPVVMLSGRIHYYENGDAAAMRVPLEVLSAIGIRNLILTNSAGSLTAEMPPGSVMRISDHINWSGMNPLIGETSERRFVGLTNAYDRELAERMARAASMAGIHLHEGVYMWFSGPSFETPAEIRMARLLGADAVGMSTVPEVILARFLGMKVAAASVITNLAAGMTGHELSHTETKNMAPVGGERISAILEVMLGGEARGEA